MSPRPKRFRKITSPPVISGFKLYGNKQVETDQGSVFLEYEEYEALKLCDYEMLNHQQAAEIMNVSRPTLTRIYARARQKIAEAMVLGKQIVIEGGKVYYDSEWFSCNDCGCFFNNPDREHQVERCALCGSNDISVYSEGYRQEVGAFSSRDDLCICPSCGYEIEHVPGRPCSEEICPECRERMVRKSTPHQKRKRKSR